MKSVYFLLKNIVIEEMRLAMLSYAYGHCKCADEVAKLKEEQKKVP